MDPALVLCYPVSAWLSTNCTRLNSYQKLTLFAAWLEAFECVWSCRFPSNWCMAYSHLCRNSTNIFSFFCDKDHKPGIGQYAVFLWLFKCLEAMLVVVARGDPCGVSSLEMTLQYALTRTVAADPRFSTRSTLAMLMILRCEQILLMRRSEIMRIPKQRRLNLL
jgi:hypothetical protein